MTQISQRIATASAAVRIIDLVANLAHRAARFLDLEGSLNSQNMADAAAEISRWSGYAAKPMASTCGVVGCWRGVL